MTHAAIAHLLVNMGPYRWVEDDEKDAELSMYCGHFAVTEPEAYEAIRRETVSPRDIADYAYVVRSAASPSEAVDVSGEINVADIPAPPDATRFWALVDQGQELRDPSAES